MRWLRRVLESAPTEVRERESGAMPLLTPEAAQRMQRALDDAADGTGPPEDLSESL